MKKIILSAFILGSFGLYVLWQGSDTSSLAYVAPSAVVLSKNTTSTSSQIAEVTGGSAATTKPVATTTSATKITTTKAPQTTTTTTTAKPPVTVPKQTGQYVDGTYVGSSANAYYGTVQVEAIISGGKIADVQFLNYPQDRNTSRRINSQAMPMLTQEAISAQSAKVNGVSGASDTSAAFKQSLASALAQAVA